jgi:adenylate cyclase
MGEQQLKNIARPVHAYQIKPTMHEELADQGSMIVGKLEVFPGQGQSGSLVGWVDPEKQSIAVLPFLNMSDDVEQEYFSDGITEDIITELARFKDLFVISRNSSFHFKGRSLKAPEIGRELSAKYIVEGSVRKSGNRVRVTAQLIETVDDNHIWAERYDRELTDIFAVQDEIVRAIVTIIPGELNRRILEQMRRKLPGNLTAYDCELRGRWAFSHASEGVASSIAWYERAIEADPNSATALANLAQAVAYGVFMIGTPASEAFARASELATRAVSIDSHNPVVLHCAAYVHLLRGDNRTAESYIKRALALNPNDHLIVQTMGEVLCYGGRPQEALEWFKKSAKLVSYSQDDRRLDLLCEVYYMLGDYETVRDLSHTYEDIPAYFPIAAACAQLGDREGSEAAKAKFFALHTWEDAARMITPHLQMCLRSEDREHWIDGYRKAGLPV